MASSVASASQPSCVGGAFGSEVTINTNRKSASYTHTIRYAFKSSSGTIATNVTISTKWLIPSSLMSLMTSGTIGTITIYADTYNGNTKIGTKSCTFTATAPASVKPSCSISITDPTGAYDTYGFFVKGLSRIKVDITPTLSYNSPILKYIASVGGNKYTTASFTTGRFSSAGTPIISASVTDARGRTGTTSQSITVADYNAPSITSLTVHRCNDDGVDNDQGEYCRVAFSASVTPLENKNGCSYALLYKRTTDTEWTAATISALDNVYSATNYVTIFPAEGESAYDVEISVADRHNEVAKRTSVSTAFTLLDFHHSGTGMRVGGIADEENCFRMSLPMKVDEPIKYIDGDKVHLELSSAFTLYNADGESRVWCRKNAVGMVELHGVVSPTNATNGIGTTSGEVICTLPLGFRPGSRFYQLCQGNGVRLWCIDVQANGNVTASRSRNGADYYSPGTNEKMTFHIVFFAN